MHVVRVTNVFLRSNNVWLKILFHGEKSISTSNAQLKEADSLKSLVSKADDQDKTNRKKKRVKWHSTNLALFGPIIKDKKRKDDILVETKKANKNFDSVNMPIPIGLLNNFSSGVKLGRKVPYKLTNIKEKKNSNLLEDPKAATIMPVLTPSVEPFHEPKLIKDESSYLTFSEKNLENKDKNNINPAKVSKKKTKTLEEISRPDILVPTTISELKLEEIVPSTIDLNRTKHFLIPNSPFYNKDNIIFPFPMVLKKESLSSSKEIITIASAKVDVPSVTQILSKTMSEKSEMMLSLWRKRKIAEIGDEGLREYMKESKLTGKELHTSIETYLRGVDYSSVRVEPRISGHWLSIKSILGSLEDVLVLESYVVHPHLKYKGFVDCVARHKDNLVVIEWKTSQRTKGTLEEAYDDPVQIAAYVGALNADDKYQFEVENALLVVAYPTGKPADVLTLDRAKCEHYWDQWLKRLEAFSHLKSSSDKE